MKDGLGTQQRLDSTQALTTCQSTIKYSDTHTNTNVRDIATLTDAQASSDSIRTAAHASGTRSIDAQASTDTWHIPGRTCSAVPTDAPMTADAPGTAAHKIPYQLMHRHQEVLTKLHHVLTALYHVMHRHYQVLTKPQHVLTLQCQRTHRHVSNYQHV